MIVPMKIRVRLWSLCATSLLLTVSTRAATADNPYEQIVTRNLFGLKDPPVLPPPGSEKPAPPAISLQGFATILCKDQVLFKVAMPAKPPQPAAEQSKIMTVGERDGEITVLEINLAERTAKFDNYGTVETKNMKDHAAKPTGAPVNMGGIPQPGMPQPGMVQPAFAVSGGNAVTPLPSISGPANAAGASSAGMSGRAANLQNSTTRQTRSVNTVPSGTPTPGQSWPPENHNMSQEEVEARIAIQQDRKSVV